MGGDLEHALRACDTIRDAAIRDLGASISELDEVRARLAEVEARLLTTEEELERLRARRSVRATDALAGLLRGGRRR